jgi:hypothetical protein
VELSPSQYLVRAEHPEFTHFDSAPWFFILDRDQATADIFLRRSMATHFTQMSWFQGRVLQHQERGQAGPAIQGTAITFINTTTSEAKIVRTDNHGAYQVELYPGHYIVTAIHPSFEPFSSEPGVFVLGPQTTTANIFLKSPH